ncbi:hypothetical protein Y1Q_0018955 [Alligator mississippiensis]|uniref:Uncharacterized protein n=1 Tax=Alligator mississippiensis TaxID=8496 RepID=A0A151M3B9_ALLMI|nr:hypothetical protein Y1Q_0018955 [Alligator mississippiensis]
MLEESCGALSVLTLVGLLSPHVFVAGFMNDSCLLRLGGHGNHLHWLGSDAPVDSLAGTKYELPLELLEESVFL